MTTKTETGIAVTNNDAPVTLQQLYTNPAIQVDRDKLNTFLNQDPPAEWVKEHPNIAGHRYLPIDKVEWMLQRFFKRSSIDVKDYRQLLNSIAVHVRVSYLDPLLNEMVYQEGVGAWELQTAKGTGILKMDASNLNRGAVPMALGIAESIAIKDACDKIGNIFGANLNRKDTLPVQQDTELANIANTKEHQRMVRLIEAAKDRTTLDGLRDHLTDSLTEIFEQKWAATKN